LYLLSFPTRRSSDLGDRFISGAQVAQLFWVSIITNRASQPGIFLCAVDSLQSTGAGTSDTAYITGQITDVCYENRFACSGNWWLKIDRKSTRLNSSHVKI